MAKTWNTKRWAWLVAGVWFWAAGTLALAAGGTKSQQGEAGAARTVKHGRSVIFRAGELPRESPKSTEHEGGTTKPALPTHHLDTTLPVLIQGAPHEWALRRYLATS